MVEAQGGVAVSLAVLLQAQLLLVQVHGRGVDSRPLQMQTDSLPPQPPESRFKGQRLHADPGPKSSEVRRLVSSNSVSQTYLNSPRDSFSSASGKARV